MMTPPAQGIHESPDEPMAKRSGYGTFLGYGVLGVLIPLMVAALGWAHGLPQPLVHDEFSYLFMADTFALGRLVNPEHPLAESFQTFYIIHHYGIYASKYFPGVGVQLLIGKALGHPIFGIWATLGLFGASMFFVMRRLFDMEVAFIISLLCSLQFMLITYFGYTYWGGSLIALAGVWILGGAMLALKFADPRYGWLTVLGMLLCLITRPFEGLFYMLPLAGLLAWRVVKERQGSPWLARLAMLLAAGFSVGVVALGSYNYQVTGNWKMFPHTLYEKTYTPHGVRFLWEKDGAKENNSFFESLPRPFHEVRDQYYIEHRERTENFWRNKLEAAAKIIAFHLPWTFQWLIIATLAYKGHWRHPLWQLCALTTLMRLGPFWLSWSSKLPHYGAIWIFPVAGLAAFGLQSLLKGKYTRLLSRLATAICLVGLLVPYAKSFQDSANRLWMKNSINDHGMKSRYGAEAYIRNIPGGKHVVIVSYAKWHNIHGEWVYNSPEIDKQDIVWAHDLGGLKNQRLMNYYHDRTVWRAEVGGFATAILKRWNSTTSSFEVATRFDE